MILSQKQIYDIYQYASNIGFDVSKIIVNGNTKGFFKRWKYLSKYRSIHGIAKTGIYVEENPYYFEVGSYSSSGTFIKICPGIKKFNEYHRLTENEVRPSWKYLFGHYKSWLDKIKEELDSIKGIEHLINLPREIFTNSTNDYEYYFSQNECKYLIEGIERIKQGITIEFDLEDYKLNLILTKLNDLQDKVDKVNKFDFKSAMWGIFVNLTSSILYDNSEKFWLLVKNSFPKLIN